MDLAAVEAREVVAVLVVQLDLVLVPAPALALVVPLALAVIGRKHATRLWRPFRKPSQILGSPKPIFDRERTMLLAIWSHSAFVAGGRARSHPIVTAVLKILSHFLRDE
jgi:hypothetical protein